MFCNDRLLLAVVLGFSSYAPTEASETTKLNVLFIVSDDLNYALSGMGHPECKTPNLDQFAQSGVSFTRAYCQFPLCGPSRASMMSGQYPLVSKVQGNGGSVDPHRITLPRHFKNHGYWTARISKIYHMGIPGDIIQGTSGRDHEPSWEEAYNVAALETMTPGIVENFTDPDADQAYPTERRRWKAARESGKPYTMKKTARGQYAVVEVKDRDTHLLPDSMTTDKAIELLRSRSNQTTPFFLAVGFVRPHFPFVSTRNSLSHYQYEDLAVPYVPQNDFADIPAQSINSVMDFEDEPIQKMRRGYFGAISFMDQQVGRLLDELDQLKLRDKTIVVFVSDHGYMMGEHHMWKKSKLWEDAIHVPLIISAPGKQQARQCDQFVELVDLYPTITELAGLPADPEAQGHSLIAVLEDPEAKLEKTDALIQTSSGFGLRSGKWAYMWFPAAKKKPEGSMLYDMEVDPNQYNNLTSHPDFAQIKTQLHKRLMKRVELAKSAVRQ